MSEYSSVRVLAVRLIKKKGRSDGVLKRPSSDNAASLGTPWKPVEGALANDPVLAAELSVVVLGASEFKSEDLTPGSTAVAYMAADTCPVVKTGDVLESRGARYSVLNAEDLAPGDESVLYILHLKA